MGFLLVYATYCPKNEENERAEIADVEQFETLGEIIQRYKAVKVLIDQYGGQLYVVYGNVVKVGLLDKWIIKDIPQ